MKKIPVYTEDDEKRFNEVLREIQSRIPAGLLKYALQEKKLTPTIEMVLQKALVSESISPEKKKQLKSALESGEYSKMAKFENPKYTRQIDYFVNREINKAIKSGRLPPKGHVDYFPSIIKINNERAQSVKSVK